MDLNKYVGMFNKDEQVKECTLLLVVRINELLEQKLLYEMEKNEYSDNLLIKLKKEIEELKEKLKDVNSEDSAQGCVQDCETCVDKDNSCSCDFSCEHYHEK